MLQDTYVLQDKCKWVEPRLQAPRPFFLPQATLSSVRFPIFLFAPLLLGTCLLAKDCLFCLCLLPLQATIDCISVPRCAGNPLHGFRYLVLMTATTVKKSSHSCHKLDVTMLERYVKGVLFKVRERGWLLTSFVSEMNQRDFRWMRLKISLNIN